MTKQKVQKLNNLLKSLFNAVTEEDFLQTFQEMDESGKIQGRIKIGKKKLTPAETNILISQAEMLQGLELWSIIIKSLKHAANEAMFMKAKELDDIIFGKATLYAIDLIEKKVENIKNLK